MASVIAMELARLPALVLICSYKHFNQIAPACVNPTKQDAIDWLAAQIEAGRLSMSDVKPYPESKDMARVDAAGATAAKAHDAAVDALTKVDRLTGEVTESQARVARLEKKIGDLSSVDGDSIKVAVAAAVAAEFVPFKQAVVAAGAQATVGAMSDVRCVDFRSALEVFGVDVCDTKGKPMTVSIWNDPSCPAVDPDFIWSAEILKHLLLSDRTGENVWFGDNKRHTYHSATHHPMEPMLRQRSGNAQYRPLRNGVAVVQ